MGTLQSFTPLPQAKSILFLYNSSKQLNTLISSSTFQKIYKFTVKNVDNFPLTEILQIKKSSSTKNIKILVQEQNLIDISPYIFMFHHKIIIITKQGSMKMSFYNQHKQLTFKDDLIPNQKIYSPLQIECFKYCISISIAELKLHIDQKKKLKQKISQESDKKQSTVISPDEKQNTTVKQLMISYKNIETKNQINGRIKINNYKRRSSHLARRQRQNSKHFGPKMGHFSLDSIQNNNPTKFLTISNILMGHYICPFTPISIMLTHLSIKMVKKIINLLQFYETDFVKYPSIQVFFGSQCNSTKIVCDSNQLQQLGKKVQADQYPFNFCSQKFLTHSSQAIINESMNVFHDTQNKIHQNQDITLYCFCSEAFINQFKTKYAKMIGVLKDKLIEIKFFKNIIELVKQLIKDQNLQIQNEILNEMNKQKHNFLSIQKLKSHKETSNHNMTDDFIKNQDKNQSQDHDSLPGAQIKQDSQNIHIVKEDSLNSIYQTKRMIKNIKQKNFSMSTHKTFKSIPRVSIVNSQGNGISLSKKSLLAMPKSLQDRYPCSIFNSTIYFLMHQKQKDRYSIQSLPKKLTRHLKNIKVKKVMSLQLLVQKIKHSSVSIVIINDNIKILQQFYNILQTNSIEDKVVVIKREEGQNYQTLIKKINEARSIGVIKVENFHQYRFLNKKIIVMGSKQFLKHILTTYPYIDVKEYIDITIYKQHRKIRQVIARKNQVVVSNVPFCQVCNQQYKGMIKAKIVFYDSNIQNNHIILTDRKNECQCNQNSSSNKKISLQSLDKLLDSFPTYLTAYPYANKKLAYWSGQIAALLGKIKEKKILTNMQNCNQPSTQIMFLCADSWIIQQITLIIVKIFSTRYSSVWLSGWMLKKIIHKCIKQIHAIIKYFVQSSIVLYKGQLIPKSSQMIQESKQIYRKLQNALDEAENLFQVSEIFLQLFVSNKLFRKCVNFMWKNLLSLNKHQYPLACSHFFIVIFLGFRKSASMNRKDSINDGTFKSFRKLAKEHTMKNKNIEKINKGENNPAQTKKIQTFCSFQQTGSFVGSSSLPSSINNNFPNSGNFSTSDFMGIKPQANDNQLKTQNFENCSVPKVYLKLSNYEKPQQDQSLRKFFVSKNNVFSYIYTTQFLTFEMIDEDDIQEVVLTKIKQKQKLMNSSVKRLNNQNGSPLKNSNNGRRRSSDQASPNGNNLNLIDKFAATSPIHKGRNRSTARNFNNIQSYLPNLSMISTFLSSNSKIPTPVPISSNVPGFDVPLQLKSSKNIQLLTSTQQSLIILVENMQLLNYNLFVPFYRSNTQTNNNDKKYFVLPPFTKLQINSNYSNLNLQNGKSTTSLVTHQLKLSIDHQQRFLQKVIQNFLVDKSEYYDSLDLKYKLEKQKLIELDITDGFNIDKNQFITQHQCDQTDKLKQQGLFILKSSIKSQNKRSQQVWEDIRLIDQKFKLPFTDQFFILMNEFKYFSAHNLLITQLPVSNMTNAYHAILLSRKGLYHQAINILYPKNPFKQTIQIYIDELRNRIFTKQNSIQDQFQSNPTKRPTKMKWKLTFTDKIQKFYLTSKAQPQKSYCYNDDSLDVIYKKILSDNKGIQQKNKLYSTIHHQQQQNDGSMIMTGTFVPNKNTTRRQKKQSSIAIIANNTYQIINSNSPRSKQLSDFGNAGSSIQRRSGINMSAKSRDSIMNDMNLLNYQSNQLGSPSSGQRRSRLSHVASSFMFRGSKQKCQMDSEKTPEKINALENINRRSMLKDLNVDQLIQEKSSSQSEISQSKSDNSNKIIRPAERKVTPISVRTRNKSNFFINKTQEMKKQAQKALRQQKALMEQKQKVLMKQKQKQKQKSKMQQKQSKQQINQNYNLKSTKSVDINQFISESDTGQYFTDQSLKQQEQIRSKQTQQNIYQKISLQKTNKTLKDRPILFRNFEKEELNKQIEKLWRSDESSLKQILESYNNDKNDKEEGYPIKINQKAKQLNEFNKKPIEIDNKIVKQLKFQNQKQQNEQNEQNKLNDQNEQNRQIRKSKINFTFNLLSSVKKTKKVQDQQADEIQNQINPNTKDQKDIIKLQQKPKQRKNKVKCRFTLDLSSQSEQNLQEQQKQLLRNEFQFLTPQSKINQIQSKQKLDSKLSLQNKQQTNQESKKNNKQLNGIEISQLDSNKIKFMNNQLQGQQQKQVISQQMVKNQSFKSPYKQFVQFLQQNQPDQEQIQTRSSHQSKQQPQIMNQVPSNTQVNGQKFKRQNEHSHKIMNFSFKKKNTNHNSINDNRLSLPQTQTQSQNLFAQSHYSKPPTRRKNMNLVKQLTKREQFILNKDNNNFTPKQTIRNSIQSSVIQDEQQQQENNLRCTQDNQDFLKTHTSLLVWHKKHQQFNSTQKILKSSKKLLNIPSASGLKINEQDEQNNLQRRGNSSKIDKSHYLRSTSRQNIMAPININKEQQRQSNRSLKNAFTFMRPSTGAQNKPIHHYNIQQDTQVDPQNQHIQDFHNRLMNNSSIFINQNTSFNKIPNQNNRKNLNPYAGLKIGYNQEEDEGYDGLLHEFVNNSDDRQQKFNIIVKTQRQIQNKNINKRSNKIIRKSAQDYNHSKQEYETSNKGNMSSDQPLTVHNKVKHNKRQSYDSWFDQNSNIPDSIGEIGQMEQNNQQGCQNNQLCLKQNKQQLKLLNLKKNIKKPPLNPYNSKLTSQPNKDQNKNNQKNQMNIKLQNYQNFQDQICEQPDQSRFKKQSSQTVNRRSNVLSGYQIQAAKVKSQNGEVNTDIVSNFQQTDKQSSEFQQQEYKVYPEQLLVPRSYVNGTNSPKNQLSPHFLINKFKKTSMNESNPKVNYRKGSVFDEDDVNEKVNLQSLRHLKLNCDIRRKR